MATRTQIYERNPRTGEQARSTSEGFCGNSRPAAASNASLIVAVVFFGICLLVAVFMAQLAGLIS